MSGPQSTNHTHGCEREKREYEKFRKEREMKEKKNM